MIFKNFIAFSLRGGSALAKLVFVTYLGRSSYNSLLGQFAIFATIAIAFTQVAGLEINQVIGRRLHALSKDEKVRLFQYQAVASIVSYFFLSALIIITYYDLLRGFWVLGGVILCLEHYTTELYRFHVLALDPLRASLVLFVKNFGWVLLFILLHHFNYVSADINTVLSFWFIFLLFSVVIGGPKIKVIFDSKEIFYSHDLLVNTWNLFWSARFFICSAVAVTGIGMVDKLLISKYFSLGELGEYYFFQTIASMPGLIISFSVGATLWPKCIKLAAIGKDLECAALWKKMNLLVVVSVILLSLAIAVSSPFVFGLLGKKTSDISLLYMLIASSSIFLLCDPYKLNLYTRKKDRDLLIGNFIQLFLVVAFVFVGLQFNRVGLVAAGMLVANALSWLSYYFQVPGKLASFARRG